MTTGSEVWACSPVTATISVFSHPCPILLHPERVRRDSSLNPPGSTSFGAFFVILFTGRYPKALFGHNVGVLRWGWRVSFYFSGGFATDRYPPSTLENTTDYPARFDVAYPEHLNRWLVLVKWLVAVPYLIIVGLLVGGSSAASTQQNEWAYRSSGGPITLLALVAVVMLAFSSSYPRSLFDLLMGLNRWVCRSGRT